MCITLLILDLGNPNGVHSKCPSPTFRSWSMVRGPWLVFKQLRDCSFVLSTFCINLAHHKCTNVTELNFEKKSYEVRNREKLNFEVSLKIFAQVFGGSH